MKLDKRNWKKVKFGDVALQQKGVVDINNTQLNRYIAGEHMDSEDIHLKKWGTTGNGYLGPAFIRKFEIGDILYGSRRTYLKKVAVADFDGITANTTFVIKPNAKFIEPKLLPFLMLSDGFTKHSIENSKGSVNPYINWKDIADYEFLLPSKEEQVRLAELLWAADEVVERGCILFNKLKMWKNVRMDILLNCKKSNTERWEKKKVADIGSVSTSGVDKKSKINETEVNLINYMDVYTSSTKKITKEIDFMKVTAKPIQLKKNQVYKGDILFTPSSETKDDIGHSAVVYEDLNNTLYSYHLVRLHFYENVNIDINFKKYMFNNLSVLAYFSKKAQGITRMTLSLDDFNNLEIFLPPIEKQELISKELSDIDSNIAHLHKQIKLSQQLKSNLINQIF